MKSNIVQFGTLSPELKTRFENRRELREAARIAARTRYAGPENTLHLERQTAQ